jgi:hypothetical protein
MSVVCIAQAILNIDNISAAMAWAVACTGWIPHVFVNQLTKEDIT